MQYKKNTFRNFFMDIWFRLSTLIMLATTLSAGFVHLYLGSILFIFFILFIIGVIIKTVAASESATGFAIIVLLTMYRISVNRILIMFILHSQLIGTTTAERYVSLSKKIWLS